MRYSLNLFALVRTKKLLRFQVLTPASMKMKVSWDVALCSLVDTDRRFRGPYCLHHQGYQPAQYLRRVIAQFIVYLTTLSSVSRIYSVK
jgi:hypothetical protein